MRDLRSFASAFGAAALLVMMGCGGNSTSSGGGGMPSAPTTTPNQPAASTVTVTIPMGAVGKGPAAYGANPLVISAGTQVTWTNGDSMPHTATSESGVFDSGTLAPGQSFSFTFDTPGTFPYFCSIHGKASMSGTVQVNP